MSVFAAGNTALITGAASGVGLAISKLCRRHGMKLALVDNHTENLQKAKTSLTTDGALVTETYNVDVSKIEQWQDLREKVKGTFGGVDMLVLNAGIAASGGWENHDYFRKIMDVNYWGVVNGINMILPMIQSQQVAKPSSIVITASKQGITSPPGNPAYNASKAAVKILAEHLSYDLRGSNTSVHLLIPGWTFTGLSGGGPGSTKEKPAGAWWPDQCAEFLEGKMREGNFYAICPDNDVSEDTDRRRMMWTAGDAIYNRPPLSRWREEFKEESQEFMKNVKI